MNRTNIRKALKAVIKALRPTTTYERTQGHARIITQDGLLILNNEGHMAAHIAPDKLTLTNRAPRYVIYTVLTAFIEAMPAQSDLHLTKAVVDGGHPYVLTHGGRNYLPHNGLCITEAGIDAPRATLRAQEYVMCANHPMHATYQAARDAIDAYKALGAAVAPYLDPELDAPACAQYLEQTGGMLTSYRIYKRPDQINETWRLRLRPRSAGGASEQLYQLPMGPRVMVLLVLVNSRAPLKTAHDPATYSSALSLLWSTLTAIDGYAPYTILRPPYPMEKLSAG